MIQTEKNATVIAVANCKGGVAKTASTAAIGCCIASRGLKVLLIDMDSQGNLSHQCLDKVPMDKIAANLFEQRKVTVVKVDDNIDIVPTDDSLTAIEHGFCKAEDRYILTRVLHKVRHDYDFILIDCPPALNWLTLNTFVAADFIAVPARADRDSLDGLQQIASYCYMAGDNTTIGSIFFTMYEKNLKLTRKIEDKIRNGYGDTVSKTVIRKCSKVAEARDEKRMLLDYAPECNAAHDYLDLTNEILDRIAASNKQSMLNE